MIALLQQTEDANGGREARIECQSEFRLFQTGEILLECHHSGVAAPRVIVARTRLPGSWLRVRGREVDGYGDAAVDWVGLVACVDLPCREPEVAVLFILIEAILLVSVHFDDLLDLSLIHT